MKHLLLISFLSSMCQVFWAQGEKQGYEIVEFAERVKQYGTIIGYSEPYAYFITVENENKTTGTNEKIYINLSSKSISSTWIQSLTINSKYNIHLYRFELRHTDIRAFPKYQSQVPRQSELLRLGIDLMQDDEIEQGLGANYKDSLLVFEQMRDMDPSVYKCTTRYGYPWSKGMPVISSDTKALVGIVATTFDSRYNQNVDVISILAIRDALYQYASKVLRNKEFADCYYFNLPSHRSNNESDCDISKREALAKQKKEMDDKAAEQRRRDQEAKDEADRVAYFKSLNRETKKNLRLSQDRFYTQDVFGEYRFLFDSTAKKSSWSLGTRSIVWAERAVSLHAGAAFGGFSQKTDSTQMELFRYNFIASTKISSRNMELLTGISYGKEFYISATVGYISTIQSKLYIERYSKRTVETLPRYSWMKYQLAFGWKFRHTDISIGAEYYNDLPDPFQKFTKQFDAFSAPVKNKSLDGRMSICVHYSYRLFGYYGQIPKREASDRYLKETQKDNYYRTK